MDQNTYYVDDDSIFPELGSVSLLEVEGTVDIAQLSAFDEDLCNQVTVEIESIKVEGDCVAIPSPRTLTWQGINHEEESGIEATKPISSIDPKFKLEVLEGQTILFKGVPDFKVEDEYRLRILEAPIQGTVLIYLKRIGVYAKHPVIGNTALATDPKDRDLSPWPIRVNSPVAEPVEHGSDYAFKVNLSGETDILIAFSRLSSHRSDVEIAKKLKPMEAKKMALVVEMVQHPEIKVAFPVRVVKVLRSKQDPDDDDSDHLVDHQRHSTGIRVATEAARIGRGKRRTSALSTAPPVKRAVVIQKVVARINQMSDNKLYGLANFLDIKA